MAHFRSHSGVGDVFHGSPTHRTLILDEVMSPLHVTDVQCECGFYARPNGTSQSSVRTFRSVEDESVADGRGEGLYFFHRPCPC